MAKDEGYEDDCVRHVGLSLKFIFKTCVFLDVFDVVDGVIVVRVVDEIKFYVSLYGQLNAIEYES